MYVVAIPSFRRPDKLIRCIDSFLKSDHEGVVLHLGFDGGDRESWAKVREHLGTEEVVVCHEFPGQNRAFRIWNDILCREMGESVKGMIFICDDTELDKDCLRVAIKELGKRFPDTDGVIGFNQQNIYEKRGFSGFCKAGMGLIGKKFADRFPNRQVFCPDYTSFKSDRELLEFSEKHKLFYWSGEARLKHHHPRFGGIEGVVDEAHLKVRDGNSNEDKEIYIRRKKKGYLWGENFKLLLDPNRMIEDKKGI